MDEIVHVYMKYPTRYVNARNYFARVPAGMSPVGSRREKCTGSTVDMARIMPLLSRPRIVRGARLVTNMQVRPTSTAGSGKCKAMPDTICRGVASAKSTISFKSLSASAIFSADRILPARISTLVKSSKLILGSATVGAVGWATGAGVGIGGTTGFVSCGFIKILYHALRRLSKKLWRMKAAAVASSISSSPVDSPPFLTFLPPNSF